ncbi:MAG: hypothetical protein WC071_03780 [Victivallaceae bacterium]
MKTTMNKNKKSKSKSKRSFKEIISEHKKVATGIAIGLVVCISATVVAFSINWTTPPDVKKDKKEAVKFVASDKFTKMSIDDQKAYLEQFGEDRRKLFRDNKLSKEEQEKLRSNIRPAFQATMKERMNKFFTMSKEDQDKELDKMIDDMKARQKARAANNTGNNQAAQSNNPNGGNNKAARGANRNTSARTKSRYEGTDSNTRAQMTAIRQALRARMQQKR